VANLLYRAPKIPKMSGNFGRNRHGSGESSSDYQDALDMQLGQNSSSPSTPSTGGRGRGGFSARGDFGGNETTPRGGFGRGSAPITPSGPSRGAPSSSNRIVGTPAGPPGLRQLPPGSSNIPVLSPRDARLRYVFPVNFSIPS
jgi:hypothetical protein